ncbi:MAG: hypothetical protein KME64_44380 [Scytonematopsis contorta HA4267-MV1]|nr:hypothetical protein [Scytonematopsis contorta HA4267-MV1]
MFIVTLRAISCHFVRIASPIAKMEERRKAELFPQGSNLLLQQSTVNSQPSTVNRQPSTVNR